MPKPRVVRAKSCETQVSKRSTSNPELASAEPPARTKGRPGRPLTVAVIGVAALIAVFATTDRGRSRTDALDECEDYAATLKRCFGEKATFRAPPPPSTEPEREFQNVAKLRLNMLFAGSTEGAHRACVLLGNVATCRAQGVPTQPYLRWAFERLGTHRDLFALPLEEMTPAAFKKTRA